VSRAFSCYHCQIKHNAAAIYDLILTLDEIITFKIKMAGLTSMLQNLVVRSNATHNTKNEHGRFLDVDGEPRRMLQPIEGYQNLPLVQLEEAVKLVVFCCPDIQRRAYIAKENCQNPPDGLDQNESASIYLYTMEWEPREQCLYYVLNATLRTENRQKLKHWLLYLKLILAALNKLPSTKITIWRGVKRNLDQEYEVGQRYVWWSLSSCTASIAILESDQFLGRQGLRTLFNIECQDGKMIQFHSSIHMENEFLLPPATQIEVPRSKNQTSDCTRSYKILLVQDFLYDHITRSNNIVCVSFFKDFIRFRLKDTNRNRTRFLK
jgi:hypothetical protein